MKKKYLAIAIAAFSFLTGTFKVQAQDTTLSFGKYLTKTPWLVFFGADFNQNDSKSRFPLVFNPLKSITPTKFAIEKDIYGFRHWKYSKGFSAQLSLTSTGLNPHTFAALDAHLKYDLNTLIGDTKWFDPYLLTGGGYTYSDKSGKDQFINFNLGGGANFWITKKVGINLQTLAKLPLFKSKIGGSNYYQHSVGLVFKIGGKCSGDEESTPKPCLYKRSKEAEDALIHLREHINK
jgi:hypothetical protein